MPTLHLVDVRKRSNAQFNATPQPIPEPCAFPDDPDPASPEGKLFLQLVSLFGSPDQESPDDPVPCDLPDCPGITLEWTADDSTGQIDFYGLTPGQEEPQRFLSLYLFSGLNPAEDRAAMKRLESYVDLSRCRDFPLVLQVTDESLSSGRQHEVVQSLRTRFR
jgi:hypothetical protein